jgi:hypothetical protein
MNNNDRNCLIIIDYRIQKTGVTAVCQCILFNALTFQSVPFISRTSIHYRYVTFYRFRSYGSSAFYLQCHHWMAKLIDYIER